MVKSKVMSKTSKIAQTAMITAVYAAATLVCNLVFPVISWGPVQLRLSEAICVIAITLPTARVGLTLGCVVANFINIFIAGTGAIGILDVIFGSFATFIGATLCWKFKKKPLLAMSMFIFSNALIVPAYLPIISQWTGFYTLPFSDISLDGYYILMYLFGVVSIAIGEAIVIFALGLPIYKALNKHFKDSL